MNRIGLYLIALVVLIAPPVSRSETPAVPEGVTYIRAKAEVNARAEAALKAWLGGKDGKLASLTGDGMPLFVGPFLSQELMIKKLVDPAALLKVDTNIQFGQGITPIMPGVGARSPEQRSTVDSALRKFFRFDDKASIRALTSDEMILIWFYIAWDIKEPIFAVEENGRTAIVDFQDDAKSVQWIEDISEPCFTLNWEGGSLGRCLCTIVMDNNGRRTIGFEPKNGDATCSAAHSDRPPSE